MICLLTSVHELGFETNLGKKMPLSNSPSKVSGPATSFQQMNIQIHLNSLYINNVNEVKLSKMMLPCSCPRAHGECGSN